MARLYDIQSRFTTKEFACPCECGFGSVQEHINQDLIDNLNMMRIIHGEPMVVTSGARCSEYNRSVGGVEDSAHLPHPDTGECRAVDILVTNSGDRDNLLRIAHNIGIDRVGIASNFLHFDVAWDLPTPVIFIY